MAAGNERDRDRPPDAAPSRRDPSPTHDRAVLRQDNGELQEDVVAKQTLDAADAADAHRADDEEADEQSAESFPASDPPSSWAGDGTDAEDRHHGDVAGRIVDRSPVADVPERAQPDDPVPRTLPPE